MLVEKMTHLAPLPVKIKYNAAIPKAERPTRVLGQKPRDMGLIGKSWTFNDASKLHILARDQFNRPGSKQRVASEKNLIKYREIVGIDPVGRKTGQTSLSRYWI